MKNIDIANCHPITESPLKIYNRNPDETFLFVLKTTPPYRPGKHGFSINHVTIKTDTLVEISQGPNGIIHSTKFRS